MTASIVTARQRPLDMGNALGPHTTTERRYALCC